MPKDQQGHLATARSRARVEVSQIDLIQDSGLLLHPTLAWTLAVTLMGDLATSLGIVDLRRLRIEIGNVPSMEPMGRDHLWGHRDTGLSLANEIPSIVTQVVQRGSKVAHTHPPLKPNVCPGRSQDRALVSVLFKAILNL